jgi:TrpR-related protein YerC/YecD
MANLLRDLCTLKELQDLSERYEVARNLAKGLSYRQVAKLTGASTTTVTRVARFLENGEGGYRKVLRTHRHHRMLSDRSSDSKIATITKERSEPTSVLEKYLRK